VKKQAKAQLLVKTPAQPDSEKESIVSKYSNLPSEENTKSVFMQFADACHKKAGDLPSLSGLAKNKFVSHAFASEVGDRGGSKLPWILKFHKFPIKFFAKKLFLLSFQWLK